LIIKEIYLYYNTRNLAHRPSCILKPGEAGRLRRHVLTRIREGLKSHLFFLGFLCLALDCAASRVFTCRLVIFAAPQDLFFGMFYGLVKTGL
jgi:hypothetical protein